MTNLTKTQQNIIAKMNKGYRMIQSVHDFYKHSYVGRVCLLSKDLSKRIEISEANFMYLFFGGLLTTIDNPLDLNGEVMINRKEYINKA